MAPTRHASCQPTRPSAGNGDGCLQCRFYLGGVGVVEAEAFGVGHHVREGELRMVPLPPAVFKEVTLEVLCMRERVILATAAS